MRPASHIPARRGPSTQHRPPTAVCTHLQLVEETTARPSHPRAHGLLPYFLVHATVTQGPIATRHPASAHKIELHGLTPTRGREEKGAPPKVENTTAPKRKEEKSTSTPKKEEKQPAPAPRGREGEAASKKGGKEQPKVRGGKAAPTQIGGITTHRGTGRESNTRREVGSSTTKEGRRDTEPLNRGGAKGSTTHKVGGRESTTSRKGGESSTTHEERGGTNGTTQGEKWETSTTQRTMEKATPPRGGG